MRIAMMTDSYLPTRDGVATAVVTLRKALEDAGHTVFVIAPDPGEEHREEGVIYFPATGFRKYPDYYLPVFPSNKREIMESLDVDVIHVYGIAFMALKALFVSRALRIPVVLTYVTNVVDTMEFYSPLPLPMESQTRLAWIYLRNLLKRPQCIIALTPSTLRDFEANGVRTKRSEVIPIGIDTGRFTENRDGAAVRRRHGLEGARVAIHVGRMSYEKNITQVVDAMEHMPGDVKLLIAGKGPAAADIGAHVQAKGLSDRVIFAGFVPDEELPQYYAAADTFVSASRFETQGLTVVEAMACGTPVACAAGRAFLDVIEDGRNGYLFEDSPEACAQAMLRCMEDRDSLIDGMRRTVAEYSMDAVGARLSALYADLTAAAER